MSHSESMQTKYTLKSIELKKVKICKFASQETQCFEAEVWVNGVRAGFVSNEGTGGCDRYVAIEKGEFSNGGLEQILNDIAVAELPNRVFHGLVIKPTSETIINDLLNEGEKLKTFTRDMKTKILYTSLSGERLSSLDKCVATVSLYETRLNVKNAQGVMIKRSVAEAEVSLRKFKYIDKDSIVLNHLPPIEAFELYKKLMYKPKPSPTESETK